MPPGDGNDFGRRVSVSMTGSMFGRVEVNGLRLAAVTPFDAERWLAEYLRSGH